MIFRGIFFLVLLTLLVSCADRPIKSTVPFQLAGRENLYDMANWSFSGRMAMSDEKNSLTGSISWNHQDVVDEIELSGPFGQGRTQVVLTENKVLIDDGNKPVHYVGNADELLATQWGIKTPISALKYWVLGLPKLANEYLETEQGFSQFGWDVVFLEMQLVDQFELPKKIKITKNSAKLKLIINQWDF